MQENVSDKIEGTVDEVSDAITKSSIWESIVNFLNIKIYTFTDAAGANTGVLKVKYI